MAASEANPTMPTDDAETLKREHSASMYDDASSSSIDALIGSSSSLSASGSGTTGAIPFARDDDNSELSTTLSMKQSGTERHGSGRGVDFPQATNEGTPSRLNDNNSDTTANSAEISFPSVEDADAAFGFPFPSMACSNQPDALYTQERDHEGENVLTRSSQHGMFQETNLPTGNDDDDDDDDSHGDYERIINAPSSQDMGGSEEPKPQHPYSEEKPRHPGTTSHAKAPTSSPLLLQETAAVSEPTAAAHPDYTTTLQVEEQQNKNRSSETIPSPLQHDQSSNVAAPTSASSSSSSAKPSSKATNAVVTAAKRPPPAAPAQPFSWNDILRVQNMIERCLQQYLSKVSCQGDKWYMRRTTHRAGCYCCCCLVPRTRSSSH